MHVEARAALPSWQSNPETCSFLPPAPSLALERGFSHLTLERGFSHLTLERGFSHLTLERGFSHLALESPARIRREYSSVFSRNLASATNIP